jgi:hypothetical protein
MSAWHIAEQAALLTAQLSQKPRPDVSASDATGVKWSAYLATGGSTSTLVTYTHFGHS